MNDNLKHFTFPCTYPLKVMGKNTHEFYAVVNAIVGRHTGESGDVIYHSRASSTGKYLSVTATFPALSYEQLEALYQELNHHELVLMTL